MRNRNISKPTLLEKFRRYKNALGVSVLALAATMGINSLTSKDVEKHINTNSKLTLGIVADLDDDKFENGVPLYSDEAASTLVTILKDGSLVISPEDLEANKKQENIRVSAINENDVKVNGYLPKKYVKTSVSIDENVSLYKIEDGQGVNLRSNPNVTPDNKIGALPKNALVFGNAHDKEWSKVTYLTKRSITTGFASSKFLQPLSNLDKTQQELASDDPDINYNIENGEVLGIDLNDISPKMLERLLTGKTQIPDKVKNVRDEHLKTPKFSDKTPSFVYFKLGASTFSSTNLSQGKRKPPYKELSAVCERLQVPYGFYYYSTSVNEEEAKLEAKWITELLEDLGPRQYNLLPLAIDVEIVNTQTVAEYQAEKAKLAAEKATKAKTLIKSNTKDSKTNKVAQDKIDKNKPKKDIKNEKKNIKSKTGKPNNKNEKFKLKDPNAKTVLAKSQNTKKSTPAKFQVKKPVNTKVLTVKVNSPKLERQLRFSRENVTNAKIILANLLEPKFGKTILYSATNALATVLDIEQYQNGINSGKSGVWFVSPPHSERHANGLAPINHYVFAKQVLLDAKLDVPENKNPASRTHLIDINTFDAEMFKACISGEYQSGEISIEALHQRRNKNKESNELIADNER